MSITLSTTPVATKPALPDWAIFGLILAVGGILAFASRTFPASMPFFAPFEFSWTEYLAAVCAAWFYWRGVARMQASRRPNPWRQFAFALGLGLIYGVLQTRYDYMAQHMFFLNRFQHLVMHHLGPFLLALSWPGEALAGGLPPFLHRLIHSRPVQRLTWALQNPLLTGVLFVGVIDVWLYPPINFRAMIDPRLYTFMNWTMVIDGIFFWCFVLDPRESPPARHGFAVRLVTVILVMFPQIALGSYLTFATHDLYAFYAVCGRLYPGISPLTDQAYGGMMVWIPASMMSGVAFLLALNNLRLAEDRRSPEQMTEAERAMAELSRRWTGR